MPGHAVKIIEIDEGAQSFSLNEAALKKILFDLPPDQEVAVVSVVGAFRTGKSFLLDFMLRYLKAGEQAADQPANSEPSMLWLEAGGNALPANQNGDIAKGQDALATARKMVRNQEGFGWRSGKDRCTTGIWMWSESFARKLPDGRTVSVLLCDTQGLFDSTLGQMLTASIFGLSVLISSYTVYNVDKRIQEDNLQHLALFSEYGRVALEEEKATTFKGKPDTEVARPFQRLEFLVRDWQAFDDESADLASLRQGMDDYLEEVLAEREHKDLKQVRQQIRDCFDHVSCFLLPHPGLDVPKSSFDGDISKIRPEFRRMLSDYVRRVFSHLLVPKRIHGRPVTGPELFTFMQAYTKMFREAKIFPEAKTLLEATAEANNRSALAAAVKDYRTQMDKIKKFVDEELLRDEHEAARASAVALFAKRANIGPKALVETFKRKLDEELGAVFDEYRTLNRLRDPFGFVAPYIVPIIAAVLAYVVRYVLDTFCTGWVNACTKTSQFLGHVYVTVFFFLFLHLLSTGMGVRGRLETMFGSFAGMRAMVVD